MTRDRYHGIMQPRPGPGYEQIKTGFSHDTHPAPERSEELLAELAGEYGRAAPDRDSIRASVRAWAAESAEAHRRLPTDPEERKETPLATAFLDYFPDAIAAVAAVSRKGQIQHGTTGWDRTKSADESDALLRHFVERGTIDTDGQRHSAKVAWRALALLQKEIEDARSK